RNPRYLAGNRHVPRSPRTIHRVRMRRGVAGSVNLDLVHNLLNAANDQPYGFLKVRGPELAREVELMAAAGLVEASGTVRGLETFSVINRVTESGHSFL